MGVASKRLTTTLLFSPFWGIDDPDQDYGRFKNYGEDLRQACVDLRALKKDRGIIGHSDPLEWKGKELQCESASYQTVRDTKLSARGIRTLADISSDVKFKVVAGSAFFMVRV